MIVRRWLLVAPFCQQQQISSSPSLVDGWMDDGVLCKMEAESEQSGSLELANTVNSLIKVSIPYKWSEEWKEIYLGVPTESNKDKRTRVRSREGVSEKGDYCGGEGDEICLISSQPHPRGESGVVSIVLPSSIQGGEVMSFMWT